MRSIGITKTRNRQARETITTLRRLDMSEKSCDQLAARSLREMGNVFKIRSAGQSQQLEDIVIPFFLCPFLMIQHGVKKSCVADMEMPPLQER